MRKLVISTLSLIVLAGCGVSPSGESGTGAPAPESVAKASSAPSLEGHDVLAEVALSPTHAVYFYEGPDSEGVVTEVYNIDLDKSVLQSNQLMKDDGHFAEMYRTVAGPRANASVVAHMQDLDSLALRRTEGAESDNAVEAAGPGPSLPRTIVSRQNVEKDFWSDADFIRINDCGGCTGWQGHKQGFGEPDSWPVCTTSPDACMFFGPAQVGYNRKSKNYYFGIVNLSETATSQMDVFYTNASEVCNIFEVVFTNCGAGGTWLRHSDVLPRQGVGMSATNSTSRSRQFRTTESDNVAFIVDVW